MKQSGHINPSEETGTGCPVTSKYGRTPPNKHGSVGRQQQQQQPTSCLVQTIGTHGGEVMCFGCVCFRGELGFMNCDDRCMCVVNKQVELLEFVFDSVYVNLKYDEIYLTLLHICIFFYNYVHCIPLCV